MFSYKENNDVLSRDGVISSVLGVSLLLVGQQCPHSRLVLFLDQRKFAPHT